MYHIFSSVIGHLSCLHVLATVNCAAMNIGLQVAFNILYTDLFLAALDLLCCMQGLLSSCRARASHCSGFSCCRTQALECVGFSNCSTWA